jgi:hypothetical protein
MWHEIFKFLSGAAFAGSIANGYLWYVDLSLPFLGFTITPTLFGIRAGVALVLFLLFFYLGWLRK